MTASYSKLAFPGATVQTCLSRTDRPSRSGRAYPSAGTLKLCLSQRERLLASNSKRVSFRAVGELGLARAGLFPRGGQAIANDAELARSETRFRFRVSRT